MYRIVSCSFSVNGHLVESTFPRNFRYWWVWLLTAQHVNNPLLINHYYGHHTLRHFSVPSRACHVMMYAQYNRCHLMHSCCEVLLPLLLAVFFTDIYYLLKHIFYFKYARNGLSELKASIKSPSGN